MKIAPLKVALDVYWFSIVTKTVSSPWCLRESRPIRRVLYEKKNSLFISEIKPPCFIWISQFKRLREIVSQFLNIILFKKG